MNKSVLLLFSLVFFFMSVGCSFFAKGRNDRLWLVRPGNSMEQVEDALGKPIDKIRAGHEERWQYELLSENSSNRYPYVALFENGLLKEIVPDNSRPVITDRPAPTRAAAPASSGLSVSPPPVPGTNSDSQP